MINAFTASNLHHRFDDEIHQVRPKAPAEIEALLPSTPYQGKIGRITLRSHELPAPSCPVFRCEASVRTIMERGVALRFT